MFPSSQSHISVEDTALVLYLWLVFLVFSAIGNVGNVEIYQISFFVICGISFLSFAGLLTGLFFRQPQIVIRILFVTFCLLLILPYLSPQRGSYRGQLSIDLYYSLLVSIPALFKLWSFRSQVFACLLVISSAGILWFLSLEWLQSNSLILIILSAVLSIIVFFVREKKSDRLDFFEVKREINFTKIRTLTLFQVSLALLILSTTFIHQPLNLDSQIFTKINLLILVIVGGVSYVVVKPKFLTNAVVTTTILLGTFLILAIDTKSLNTLHVVLMLVFLSASSVGVLSRISSQILITWSFLLSYLGKAMITSVSNGGGYWLIKSFESVLVNSRVETILLLCGTLVSVLIKRIIWERQLAEDEDILNTKVAKKKYLSLLEGSLTFTEKAVDLLKTARIAKLQIGFLSLAFYLSTVSFLALIATDIKLWPMIIVGWMFFVLLTLLLFYCQRKIKFNEYHWLSGAIVILLMLLWVTIVLSYTKSARQFWVLWPAGVMLGLGTIPWAKAELFSFNFVVTFAAIIALNSFSEHVSAEILVIVIVLGCDLFCAYRLRDMREQVVNDSYAQTLTKCKDDQEVYRAFSENICFLLNQKVALISYPTGQYEYLNNNALWSVSSQVGGFEMIDCPVIKQYHFNEAEVKLVRLTAIVQNAWTRFLNNYFPKIAIVISLKPNLDPGHFSLCISLSNISQVVYLINQLDQLDRLAVLTKLNLQINALQIQRTREEKSNQATQAEREYELSNIVHDINNTVQDLMLHCDNILEETEDKNIFKNVKRITTIARSMATIVSDAKRKREIERLSNLTPRELVEVNEVVLGAVEFASIRAERKRIVIKVGSVPEIKLFVRVSAQEHLEIILRNLLNNAIMYSNAGTIVEVNFRYDAEFVYIDVRDNGPGLSEEESKAVFMPGYKGKHFSAGFVEGLGIGLAQSRRIAESAYGSLEVYSAGAGYGATFTLVLPRQPESLNLDAQGKFWALLVDDQPTLTDFYSRIAKAFNFIPITASSVAEATQKIEDHGPPQFVITDLHLNGSDGVELIEYIRKKYGDNLPIIVLTGKSDEVTETRVKLAGATDFLYKPIGQGVLFSRIQSLLSLS